MQCHLHSFEQRQVLLHHDVFHELHKHLRVGVAFELHTLCLKLHLDVGIVLDYAVMDDGKVMGMSIACRRLAMRRPACVGNTHAARHILVAAILRQVVNLAFGLIHIEFSAVANHCHAGTVIAAILQALQAFNQNRISFLRSDVTYNSTHNDIYNLIITRPSPTLP